MAGGAYIVDYLAILQALLGLIATCLDVGVAFGLSDWILMTGELNVGETLALLLEYIALVLGEHPGQLALHAVQRGKLGHGLWIDGTAALAVLCRLLLAIKISCSPWFIFKR